MTSELAIKDGKINVIHEWTVNESYTCSIETITASLYDEDFETEDVSPVTSSLVTIPEDLPELVYDSFPITVNSSL